MGVCEIVPSRVVAVCSALRPSPMEFVAYTEQVYVVPGRNSSSRGIDLAVGTVTVISSWN